jgi:DNA (cytosine-5)-methyltransferase 1
VRKKYSIVDLFAGAGGLSYGFLQTGHFEVKAAFENNRNAQKTYKKNHGDAAVYDDVADALTVEIKQKLGMVDVVIGGPPCQGFSNANRQKNHAISQNNSLVKKFVQAVLHLNPTAFVMENVSMLQSNVHQFFVDENDGETIKKYGIQTTATTIPLLDAEFLFEGAEDVVADVEAINRFLWDEEEYLVLNVIYKNRKNGNKLIVALTKHQKKLLKLADVLLTVKGDQHLSEQWRAVGRAIRCYFEGKLTAMEAEKLCVSIEPAIMLQRMLSKALEIHENKIVVAGYNRNHGLVAEVTSMAVIEYIKKILGAPSSGYVIKDGVLSAATFGAPQKRMRFVIIGIKKERASEGVDLPKGMVAEDNFNTVWNAISDIEDVEPSSAVSVGNEGVVLLPKKVNGLGGQLRDSKKLYNHVATDTTPEALERFKAIQQGANFHSLAPELRTTYSDPKRTQNTIYLRLNYQEPSGTVVNVRKSMWIHPVKDRALSVREAARLQTFPDSFIFCGTKDSQYQQVGNAVPPILAKAIAEHLYRYLDDDNDCNPVSPARLNKSTD